MIRMRMINSDDVPIAVGELALGSQHVERVHFVTVACPFRIEILAFAKAIRYPDLREITMTLSDPNQALRPAVALSTAIISVLGLVIIGVGVTGPA